MQRKSIVIFGTLAIILIFAVGFLAGYFYLKNFYRAGEEAKNDIHVEFLVEIYDKIKENYWNKILDEQLSILFKLGAEKLLSAPQILESNDRQGVIELFNRVTEEMEPAKKKEFTVQLGDIVLANLEPFGRSRLFGIKQKENLQNMVNNVDTNINFYDILGVKKDSSAEEIEKAHENKVKELSKDTSSEAKQMLANVERAYAALAAPKNKQRYDQTGAEPTIESRIVSPSIFYIRIKRFSPATIDEFKEAADSTAENTALNSLILDLRGNIGGAIDLLQYFLGPFIGENQFAFEFFHQGESKPFKTKTGWLNSLVKFKKVVVLIDGQTQSTGELMAATLKKYNVGVLVGAPTKGWGTIEQVMPLKSQIDQNENYSVLIVHSLTLRDDGQPIEGRGIEPVISIKSQNWQEELLNYFNYSPLTKAVERILEE